MSSVNKNVVDREILEEFKLDQHDMDITLNNVVASFNIGLKSEFSINLLNMVMRGFNMELRSGRQFAQVRLRSPKCSANVFSSGKVTIVGNTCKDDARLAATKLTRRIKKMVETFPDIINAKMVKFSSETIKTKRFRIVNIWASTQLPWAVKLNQFAADHRDCDYEPELSAAITYHITEPKSCVKIFSTGNLIIQSQKIENIQPIIRFIYLKAFSHKKPRKKVKTKEIVLDDDKMWTAHGGYGAKSRKIKRS